MLLMHRKLLESQTGKLAAGFAALVLVSGLAGYFLFCQGGQMVASRERAKAAPRAETEPTSIGSPRSGSDNQSFFQKGINYTAEYPDVYGSTAASERLVRLKEYGINAIALVPYGFESQGSTRIRFNLGWEKDTGVEQLAAVAHQAGMRVLLKPQLYVRNGYPGSLEFPAADDLQKWFGEYQVFLEHYALLAKHIHADLFCVGVELDKLSRNTDQWRRLIRRVREIYAGPLVYAANFGTEFESVQFWDSLDYIGMDEYYSLPNDLSTDEIVAKVSTIQQRFARPVIFTEVGFPSVEEGNRDPWDERHGALSPELQAQCYEQIYKAFYNKPWFEGMYWWKVGTNGFGGLKDRSHTPWGKPAMEVIRRWYLNNDR